MSLSSFCMCFVSQVFVYIGVFTLKDMELFTREISNKRTCMNISFRDGEVNFVKCWYTQRCKIEVGRQ